MSIPIGGRGLWLPRRTIRLRLTLVYGCLFLVSSAALLAITYVLAAHAFKKNFFVTTGKGGTAKVIIGSAGIAAGQPGNVVRVGDAVPFGLLRPPTKQQVTAAANAQSQAVRSKLLVDSAIALGIMAVLSICLGWVVAGRALRPLRTIANAAREISATNLHRRLALDGPDDELRQLTTTFDDLLARLEASFAAQRSFVSNASHELRTPLTLERTLLEVALADPHATAEQLRKTCEQVLETGEQQERLIESLLTLSRSQRGLDRHEPVDLAALTASAMRPVEHNGVRLTTSLQAAATSGDARLVERLAANLVSNAVRYNVPGGRVDVTTGTRAARAVLTVANTGPVVPSDEIDRLFQPFQRLETARTGIDDGTGLGLSIVRAIADAHAATISALALPEGGLRIEVSFAASG